MHRITTDNQGPMATVKAFNAAYKKDGNAFNGRQFVFHVSAAEQNRYRMGKFPIGYSDSKKHVCF